MARSARLSIVGAIEEVGCEGSGCPGCPYATGDELELACSVEVPGEPLDLARQMVSELSLTVSSPGLEGSLGHDADVGRVYDVRDLAPAVSALRDVLGAMDEVLDAQGRDRKGVLRFNERMAIDRAAELLERAHRYEKRVVLEI